MRNIVEGVLATLVVFFVIGLIVVGTGAIPSGADAKPSIVEQLAAKVSLNVSLRRESSGLADPLPLTEQNLDRGVKLYAANCAVCHGAADARASTLSKGFYIKAPQLAKDGVEDDAETVTFLKLKHGIRFSAMPAFGGQLSDQDLWRLTAFLKHMDKLPQPVDAYWKKVPSAASPNVSMASPDTALPYF